MTVRIRGAGLGNHEPNISPDSKWLAYTSSEVDAPNVFVVEVAHPENRYQL